MSYPDVVQKTVDEFAKSTGMVKHSGAWYGSSAETWTIVQPQRSQYKPAYYLNTGFWLRAAGDKPYPREPEFHIRARLDALLADRSDEISHLLDLRNQLPDEERGQRLESILRLQLLPILRRGATIVGLQELYRDGVLDDAALRGEALTLLHARA